MQWNSGAIGEGPTVCSLKEGEMRWSGKRHRRANPLHRVACCDTKESRALLHNLFLCHYLGSLKNLMDLKGGRGEESLVTHAGMQSRGRGGVTQTR